ncbi:MAG: hypothetical protein KGM16_07585 [Bacteroidota bacterium]|nr:hypothetical protein [Bacteroidota bacterium]
MFNNLHELIATMQDEKSCRNYLIKERWNDVTSTGADMQTQYNVCSVFPENII